ncbi:hypothetical protein [Sphingobacterium daejeonense]|uniref:hypothetical protein n=1 Tax=Sphingobacterium daejeonense TaxID=371142 RepID=UPI001E57C519|nr:hypothetical protein [Sphingobacterium daejeonense]
MPLFCPVILLQFFKNESDEETIKTEDSKEEKEEDKKDKKGSKKTQLKIRNLKSPKIRINLSR